MISKFIPLTVNTLSHRKLVIVRDEKEEEALRRCYPLAEPTRANVIEFPADVVYRALRNFMQGETGLVYCRNTWGE